MTAPDTEHVSDLNVTRARQGRRGVHMFWVLVISTLLAGAVMGVIWLAQSRDLARVHGQGAADPASAMSFKAQAVPNTSPPPAAARPTPVNR
jgi:hypothetical protein